VQLEPDEDRHAVRRDGGALRLDVTETQAVVSIDGTSRGLYSGAVPLAPGPHALLVERGGFRPVERMVTIDPGRTTSVRVELEPTPDTRAAYVGKAQTLRTLGVIGVAAGAVIAGAGVGFLIYNKGPKDDSQEAIREYNKISADRSGGRCDPLGDTPHEACEQEKIDLQNHDDAVRGRDVIGYVGLGVGVAALGAGVILLLVGDNPSRYDRKRGAETLGHLVVAPSHGGSVLGYSRVF
jgi:hypothetical protein